MPRPRTHRQNPVPGTKSTQSRYYLGYFVFVDSPDQGYAVSVRAAAPTGESPLPKAVEAAEGKAQRMSNKLGRSIAFMPLSMTQATKADAIRHLYGPERSELFGGPFAHAKVTLSRSRLPNRPVAETALPSVEAHWKGLYGPGVKWARSREGSRMRSASAYRVGPESSRFSPYVPEAPSQASGLSGEALGAAVAKQRARLQKVEAMRRSPERPEAIAAERIASREAAKLSALEAELLRFRKGSPEAAPLALLDAAELRPTLLSQAWALRVLGAIPAEQRKGAFPADVAQGLVAFVESALRRMKRQGKPITIPAMLDLYERDNYFEDYRALFRSAGWRRTRDIVPLFQATVQVLADPGSNP
jgi:hypothetical protein